MNASWSSHVEWRSREEAPPPRDTSGTIKQKVLVVDEEQSVADTLRIIFQKRGFECRTAYSGAEAIACTDEFCPELLLCDISMPGTDGLEVVSHVTRKCPKCRVLLLTGHYTNLRYDQDWARTHPAPSRIMTKPVPPAILLDAAGALLQSPQS
jgi:DNA-binding NtrC family response regulator